MTAARIAAAAAEPDEACTEACARLEALARGLLPPGVAVATLDPRLVRGGLLPEEEPAVAAAVARRRREFTAGRIAARRAMAKLGLPPRPVPAGPDRAPIWPEGIVGSISHSDTACLVAVAPLSAIRSLGVDVENDAFLETDLWKAICCPEELTLITEQPPMERGRLVCLLFSAKEAAYKCLYPLTRSLLDFDELRIWPDMRKSCFTVSCMQGGRAISQAEALTGRWDKTEGLIVAASVIKGR